MEKILIVEEDRFFRDTFSSLLKGEGYEVDCADCGSDGLQMLATSRYGLVITDLTMPDISGMEILSRVRETDPTIDVMMMTGNANTESAIFALKHGARDYLIKPVDPVEFCHSVALCMQQRRLLDENEELKHMVSLFQASQAIAGCLEPDRIYHLLVDAMAREIGVSRAIGMFVGDGSLELKEAKGLASSIATQYYEDLLACICKFQPHKHLMSVVKLVEKTATKNTGIKEACLIFIRNKEHLQGVVALFNDSDKPLPELPLKKNNIIFLIDQASRAFDNINTYSQAKDMLFIDDLSGLYNHRYLEVALERELKRAERYASHLAILFLDIDFFKRVNDTHGHLVGSRVLKEMGALLKKSVREVDVVIRYGGDEYTIILVETGFEIARVVAERIRLLIASHAFLASEGLDIRLTCSIGVSCCPDDTMSKQELLEMADQAMYVGKSSGKNCVTRFLKKD